MHYKLKTMRRFLLIGFLTILFSCQNDKAVESENQPKLEEQERQQELIREKEIKDSIMVFRSCENYSGITFDKLRNKLGEPFDEIKDKYGVSPFETVMYYRGEIYNGYVKQCFEGQISSYFEFKNGLANGEIISYFSNGRIGYKGGYKNGKEHGEFVSFDTEGNKTHISTYEFGVLVKKTVFD